MKILELLVNVLLWFPRLVVQSFMELVQTKYRWIVVIPIVLPLSLLYNFYLKIRNKFVFLMVSSPKRHAQKVAAVAAQMKKSNAKMCTSRSVYDSMSIFHAKYKETLKKIDLSNFIDILQVDTVKRTVRVEPLVTCGQLTHALLPLGWTAAVLPELDDLTVGGLIMGFGIESSSHKYGLFQHICESYEIILPGGEVVVCSKTENPDLFYAIPWSHGTIGFLLSAEIQIVPAKKYACITYEPCTTRQQMVKRFEEASRDTDYEFVECLAYGPEKGVVMTGVFSDIPTNPSSVHNLGAWYGPWFYKHVESFFTKGKATEFIPLRDYYHRHTKSIFWNLEDIIPFGNNILFRIFLGWLLPPKIAFLKMTTTEKLHELHVKTHFIEDFLVPVKKLNDTLDMLDEMVGFYPLWLCPCKIYKTPFKGLINPGKGDDLYVDVGIYGMVPKARANPQEFAKNYLDLHHTVEKWIRNIGGYQALYALTHQSKKEFEEMFDHTLYEEVRKKYNCDSIFPQLYQKVSREGRK